MFFYLNQPPLKTIVFFDGQNIYHLAKNLWSSSHIGSNNPYSYPSYDVELLAHFLVNQVPNRILKQIRFYTGVPNPNFSGKHKFWYTFWNSKSAYLKSRGIYIYRGRINEGGQEKGVDVNLAIDLIELTYDKQYDVAIIVSQDWDFGGAVKMAKRIAKSQGRMLTFASAFPYSPTKSKTSRGVPGTSWIQILKSDYDSCIDSRDYRPII